MEIVTSLTAPPVPGKFYLVPTIRAYWAGSVAEWPVLGPKHNDRQHLDFEPMHYHTDVRFLAVSNRMKENAVHAYLMKAHAMPISFNEKVVARGGPQLPEEPYLRRWKCQRASSPVVDEGTFLSRVARFPESKWKAHHDYWAGKQASHDGNGWVCPHRNVPLSSQPNFGPVVICPLHNLHICNRTGRVLSLEESIALRRPEGPFSSVEPHPQKRDRASAIFRGSEGERSEPSSEKRT